MTKIKGEDMNELSSGKTMMTVKEVANVYGVSHEAIKKHVRELYPGLIQNGKTTHLTEEQVVEIKKRMRPTTQVVGAVTDTEMYEQTLQVMIWLSTRIKAVEKDNERLQIELDEHKKWYSVKRVQAAGLLEERDPRKVWSPLKQYSIKNGYQIKTIFDPNFGEVKTYHADVWKAVYGVDFDSEEVV